MEICQLSPQMQDMLNNLKQFTAEEEKKVDKAVADASKDQDNPDADSNSTQSS